MRRRLSLFLELDVRRVSISLALGIECSFPGTEIPTTDDTGRELELPLAPLYKSEEPERNSDAHDLCMGGVDVVISAVLSPELLTVSMAKLSSGFSSGLCAVVSESDNEA